MNYYLDLFTPHTWDAFCQHGATVSGFTEHMHTRAARVKPGDRLICYLVRLSRWCGALEVQEGPYTDTTPVFSPTNDKFIVRFKVRALVTLEAAHAIPIGELWELLNRTKDVDRSNRGWAYSAQLISSLGPMDFADGQLLVDRLLAQEKEPKPFPFNAADRRILSLKPVLTPKGAVEVVVPEDAEDSGDEVPSLLPAKLPPKASRDSIAVQATLASIGAKMGYSIWVPRNDRVAVNSQLGTSERERLLEALPLNYEDATLRTIEQIDVIWLRRRSIVRAFEVEHTTAVYSGLLRMADLLALQPNIDIRLHIVADVDKREKVFREIKRPVFSLLESGALSESCSYLSYDSVAAISRMPHLSHMTDTIIDEYQELAE